MFCTKCGQEIIIRTKFCRYCGHETMMEAAPTLETETGSIHNQVKGTFLQATEKVNQMVGEEGSINVNLCLKSTRRKRVNFFLFLVRRLLHQMN